MWFRIMMLRHCRSANQLHNNRKIAQLKDSFSLRWTERRIRRGRPGDRRRRLLPRGAQHDPHGLDAAVHPELHHRLRLQDERRDDGDRRGGRHGPGALSEGEAERNAWQFSKYMYTIRRPVMGEVLSTRIWGVPPACLGSR